MNTTEREISVLTGLLMLHLPVFASGAIREDVANLQRHSRLVSFAALLSFPFGRSGAV